MKSIVNEIGGDIYMNAVVAQETFNPYTIGNSLRNLRENRKKTQMEVAGALGICNSHYARLEGGMRGMSLNMLFLLMGYFQTDANTILGISAKEDIHGTA